MVEAYVRRAVEYSLTREVDRTRLVRFERYAAQAPILSRLGDSCVLDTLGVLLYVLAYHHALKLFAEFRRLHAELASYHRVFARL